MSNNCKHDKSSSLSLVCVAGRWVLTESKHTRANFHPILSLLASLRPNTDPLGFANTENNVKNKEHIHSPCTEYLTYSSKLAVNK